MLDSFGWLLSLVGGDLLMSLFHVIPDFLEFKDIGLIINVFLFRHVNH